MSNEKETHNFSESTTYQMENRQFIVRRSFAKEKTVAELLTAEITSGILQPTALSSTDNYGIIRP